MYEYLVAVETLLKLFVESQILMILFVNTKTLNILNNKINFCILNFE